MKNINRISMVVIILLLFLLVGIAIPNLATNQRVVALPLSFANTFLSEEDWLRYGREVATRNGLMSEPIREETALMTYGSYLVLTEANLNNSLYARDNPVFVYQVFGDIPTLNGFGSAAGRTDIEGFIFVFDARTGLNFTSTALSKGKPGALDLSFIPADPGPILGLQAEIVPTMIVLPELDFKPEVTSEIVPLPAVP